MKKISKSKINAISAAIDNVINVGVSFLTRRFFVQALGIEILGINGLFGNIVSMLSIVELGFSYAVIYNMYRPIVKNDHDTIKSLVDYYKKIYRIVGLTVFAIGIIIMPFLPMMVTNYSGNINIFVAYGLILADTVFSYFLSYRRSFLYATKNNNIININHSINSILMNAALIVAILLTKSFYLYLALRFVFRIVENIILHVIAGKKYPYIKERNIKPLKQTIKKDIKKKVKALLVHKVGTFVVLGTDNIIISVFLGVAEVGLYSNYYAIISAVQNLLNHTITALTPSVGHILVEKNTNKNYAFFKKILRINYLVSLISAICLCLFITPFIRIWLGNDYLLAESVVIVLVINFFQASMRTVFSVYKEAAGIYYEDRFVPIIESIINIVASIALVNIFGLVGVFVGTIISSLILWLYSYPKYIYKPVFKRSYKQYYFGLIMRAAIYVSLLIVVFLVANNVKGLF